MKTRLLFACMAAFAAQALAQGTAFTYQGRLNDGASAANGIYDLRFTIYDSASDGAIQGGPITNSATSVSDGLFTATLNFGAGIFNGANRFLEIAARTNGGGAFTPLSPRQAITATPYSLTASNLSGALPATQLTGTLPDARLSGNVSLLGTSVDSAEIADGSIVNGDISASAAIADTKLATLATAGKVADTALSGNVSKLGANIDSAEIADGSIVDADISPTAAIADAKLATISSAGKVADSALSTNIARLNGTNVFTGTNTFAGAILATNANNVLAGSFTGTLPATQLTGTINDARLSANVSKLGASIDSAEITDGAVTSAKVATATNWFAFTIANPTPEANDQFGISVAAVGNDRVLIGAYLDDTGAANAGAAYLFSTNGVLLTTFTNPIPAAGDLFGNTVAAVGSDRVLIGAYADDTGATNAGAAYLFSTNGILLTTFTNPTPAVGDLFGNTVAAVGSDRVLIGAPQDSTGANNVGAAYLFSTNGVLLTTFTNPTPGADDLFGYSVAAVGSDRVLIGAFGDNTGANAAGAAYLFSTNGVLLTTFTNPTPVDLDVFGYSVAAVGSGRVLIGAREDDTGATNAGAAYLFSTNGILLTTFTNPTPEVGDSFGYSIAAVGNNRVLIGAYLDDTGAASAGAAYLFSTNGVLLTTFTNPTPADLDNFGYSVAAVGNDRVLVGAYPDNTGADSAGAAYLFSLESYTPGLVADAVSARSITTASLEDGAVTAAKIGGVLFQDQIPELDAAKLTSGTLSSAVLGNAWKTGGNAGTLPGTHFLGTTDNQPLEFKVNNEHGLRLEYADDGFGTRGVNVVGGYSGNSVGSGAVLATIGGGGVESLVNQVTDDFGTVSGGIGNAANGRGSTVGGGQENIAGGSHATIFGGYGNTASGNAATVAGGTVNTASENHASVGGGFANQATNLYATVPGGSNNVAGGFSSFAAGHRAKAYHGGSFVWADAQNADFASTADNQFNVRAAGGARFFTGGTGLKLDTDTVVFSGSAQRARFGNAANVDINPLTSLDGLLIEQGNSESSGIFFDGDSVTMWSPGDNNRLFRILDTDDMGSGAAAAVRFAVDGAGGIFSAGDVGIRTDTPDRPLTIQGTGGNSEWLSLKNSSGITKWHLNHFNGGLNFVETGVADNRLFLRAGGNVGIGTSTPDFRLEVNGTAGKPGGGSWSVASDARLKKNVADLHGSLDRLLRLRSVSFDYKDPAQGVGPGPQIGFLAQEVREVLPQWVTEGSDGMLAVSVTGFESLTVDALRELRAEKDQQIGALKAENAELKQRLEKLEQLLAPKLAGGAR